MLRRSKPLTRKKPLRASRAPRAAQKHADPADEAERKLWSILEDRDVAGLRFRHRERVGPIVADFICPAARLVLLLTDEQANGGKAAWLRDNGYRVLEFPIGEVCANPGGVLEAIARSFELRIVSRKS